METNISQQLEDIIELSSNNFLDDEITHEFELASIKFNELVENGFAHKRGYNLLSITDTHLHNIRVNFQNIVAPNYSFLQKM